MDLRIEGGNSGLVNALAERIGLEAIHTDMEVQSVTQTDQRVAVKAEDVRTRPFAAPQSRSKAAHRSLPTKKRTFAAAYCICTVPARSLNSITWKPALAPSGLAARNLQYAKIMKTVLLFKTRFWEKRMGNTWCKPSMTT